MLIAIDDTLSKAGIKLVSVELELNIEELEPILAPTPSIPIPPPLRLR